MPQIRRLTKLVVKKKDFIEPSNHIYYYQMKIVSPKLEKFPRLIVKVGEVSVQNGGTFKTFIPFFLVTLEELFST